MTYAILAAWGSRTGKTRRARKEGRCQDCRGLIAVGDKYIVGSQKDYQFGPYAHERLCQVCAAKYGLFVDGHQATEFRLSNSQ